MPVSSEMLSSAELIESFGFGGFPNAQYNTQCKKKTTTQKTYAYESHNMLINVKDSITCDFNLRTAAYAQSKGGVTHSDEHAICPLLHV